MKAELLFFLYQLSLQVDFDSENGSNRQVVVSEQLCMLDACERIHEKMNEIMSQSSSFQGRSICLSTELVVRYQAPTCADMDLVDLPGILAAVNPDDDPKFSEKSMALATRYIKSNEHCSMFLVVVEALG